VVVATAATMLPAAVENVARSLGNGLMRQIESLRVKKDSGSVKTVRARCRREQVSNVCSCLFALS
jgi:hypothetical protein